MQSKKKERASTPGQGREDFYARVTALFNAIYEQSDHLGGILGLDGTLINANRAACAMIGVTPSQVVGTLMWETPWFSHSAAEQDKMRDGVGRASRGESVQFESSHPAVDGSLRFVDLTLKPVRGPSGRPTCLIVEARDITEARRAEEQRRAGESMLRSVYSAAPVGITFNVGRVIKTVNDSMCDLLGYSEAELVGQSARIFYDSQEEFERAGRELYGAQPRQGRTSVETRFRRKDGLIVFVILTAAMLDPEDPGAGFVVAIQDVSERRTAEAALRESEDRFRGVMEQSPFSVQVLSPRGDVLEVNKAFEKLWGVGIKDLPGYNILQDEQIRKLGFMPVVEKAFLGEQVRTPVVQYDVSATLGAGVRTIVEGVFYPIRDAAGALRYVILIHLDLTERTLAEEEKNKLQEQLQQAMKMEAVGRLAGGIAHDFNNLLTTISGNVELARSDPTCSDPLALHLEEISQAAESAATLTRQLLAFSRRQIIEPRVIDLNALVTRLQKMLTRLLGEDVTLNSDLEPGLGFVKVDPGQFEQVLVNLAVNARDAMPDGGRLLIETSNRELDEQYTATHPQCFPGLYVMLAVSDTGHGMNDEVKQRIFEPFFTTKPKGRGTGLGLATIFGIVNQAGGTIEIYSEVGLGTSFKIYLPRINAGLDGLPGPSMAAPVQGRETILLVEDDRGVRELARTVLVRLGYVVLDAPNGKEALLAASRHPEKIDLVLTDVVMPGMNGRELAEKLVALRPDMKVLFTSGYTENVIVHHGVLEEDLNFIGKPYSRESLSKKIRETLDSPRLMKP